MATGEVTPELLNAFQRLVDLLFNEQDIAILAPAIKREIIYRLLISEQGTHLRQIASAGSQSQQVARTVEYMKESFAKPLPVEDLATRAGMSVSTFHNHFRAMTALSPLQFQKQLRLQEARRLMLSDHLDAASAAFRVGYESPSQFSREYCRFFGSPPLRDIATLRSSTKLYG
jgi:AraC-like DNA-binding protein